ncbi:MAG TPA: Nif3-like dinuclear metal center hexameric protein [Solirubrobacteraceae bacterium]
MPRGLTDILSELNRLLEPERFRDYCPNGLQVPGRTEIETVATGVSAHAELFELARAEQADLLVVHHGLFWNSDSGALDIVCKQRLQLLFQADISLAAYHLPLDAHPQLGNNAQLARRLGATELERFAMHHGEPIGFIGQFPDEGITPTELLTRVQELTDREPLMFEYGPAVIRRLAIVSGAGSDYLSQAIDAGAEAFLTGEPAERVMAHAREAGVHFLAAGHYATETLGVQALGEHLASHFGLRHVYLDVPNPI